MTQLRVTPSKVGSFPPMAYAENFENTQKKNGGGFIEWHMVVICIWSALFVTSQFDVIFMFPNQRFDEVC